MFLSSGIIKGGVTAQDKIIDTAEILRKKYSYRGYIHLKIMPGAEYDQIRRAMQLADRVSINLEGPPRSGWRRWPPKRTTGRRSSRACSGSANCASARGCAPAW